MWIHLTDDDVSLLAGGGEETRTLLDTKVTQARQDLADGAEYFSAAQTHYTRDGELEFDDGAVVSISEDGGAYVMGWRWVADEEAGIDRKEEDTCCGQ